MAVSIINLFNICFWFVCFILFYFLPHLELRVCCCHNWYISGSSFEEKWQKINRWTVVWPGLSMSEFCYPAKHFYSLWLMSEHMQRWMVNCAFSGVVKVTLKAIKKMFKKSTSLHHHPGVLKMKMTSSDCKTACSLVNDLSVKSHNQWANRGLSYLSDT